MPPQISRCSFKIKLEMRSLKLLKSFCLSRFSHYAKYVRLIQMTSNNGNKEFNTKCSYTQSQPVTSSYKCTFTLSINTILNALKYALQLKYQVCINFTRCSEYVPKGPYYIGVNTSFCKSTLNTIKSTLS